MSRLIGEAYISLLADASMFPSDAKTKVDAALKGIKGDIPLTGNTKDIDAKIAAVSAALKKLNGEVRIKADTRAFIRDIATAETAVLTLMERLDNIPMDADNSKFLAKLYGARSVVNGLAKQLENMDADGDMDKLISRIYGVKSVVEGLETDMSHLDADGDTAKMQAKLGALGTVISGLAGELEGMRADVTDAALLAKVTGAQSVVLKLAKSMRNMPMSADTLPLEADVYKAIALVEGLRRLAEKPIPVFALPKTPGAYSTFGTGAFNATEAQMMNELTSRTLEGLTATDRLTRSTEQFKNAVAEAAQDVQHQSQFMEQLAAHTLDANMATDRLTHSEDAFRQSVQRDLYSGAIGPKPVPLRLQKAASLGIVGGAGASAMDATLRNLNTDLHDVTASSRIAAAGLARIAATDSMIIKSGLGGWLGFANTKIRLMGGALDSVLPKWARAISVWHLAADVAFEIAAAWAPALIAVATFAAYAFPTGEKIMSQWKNINTVLDGVGGKLPDLGRGFDIVNKAIEPSVISAFGAYMNVIGRNSGPLGQALQGVGKVVDVWGAGMVTWAAKAQAGFNSFVRSGSGDFALIGEGFHQLFRIISELIHDMPGIVHVLLPVGDAFLKVTGNIIQAFGPILKYGLLLHGILVYAGLAVTAVVALGRAVAGGALATYLTKTTSATFMASAAAGEATGKFSKFGLAIGSFAGGLGAFGTNTVRYGKTLADLGNDAANVGTKARVGAIGSRLLGDAIKLVPFGAAGLGAIAAAAAIGGILYFAVKHTTDATVVLAAKLNALIGSSNAGNIGKNISIALVQTQKQLNLSLQSGTNAQQQYNKAVSSIPVNVSQAQANSIKNVLKQQQQLNTAQQSGYAAAQKANPTSVYQQVTAVQQKAIGEAETYGQRMNSLTGIFGSNAGALSALNLLGISAGKIAGETNAQWATQFQELKNLAAGYGYMSSQAGAAGAQLNALNLVSGTTYKNIQALTQAEGQWVAMVTSGESAFTSFEQGFTGLNGAIGKLAKNAPTVSITTGKLRTTFQALGGTMAGTSASSLAVRQAFDQQLTAGTTLFGNLQMLAGASGNTAKAQRSLGKAGKDIIAQLLPFAAGSRQATAEVSALAQLMGGPATSDFKTLAKWVGHTKGSMGDLNTQQGILTISASNLTAAEKNLGNTLQTEVTQAQAAAIAKTINLTGATQNLAAAATNTKNKMSAAALAAAGQYVAALEKAGISTGTATQYLNAYLGRLGYTPGQIHTLDAALSGNKKKFEDVAGSMGLSKKAADKLFDSLQKLKQNSPYDPKVDSTISGQGGIVAKANIPGQPALSARLNFSAAAHGLAGGGVVRGGIHGQDSVPALLAPGELVVPSSHAPAFGAMAKAAGIPGMASGGVAGQVGAINSIVPFSGNTTAKFDAEATAAFTSSFDKAVKSSLQKAAQAAAGAGGKYGGPSSFGGGFESLPALVAYARYFMANGLNMAAAAGMAATISGEQTSAGPESVGSGGFGLIGWTGNTIGLPSGYHGPTGNVAFDLSAQLAGVIGYMNSRGGRGPLNAAGNPVAAGDVWSRYEAPLVPLSDTRPGTANAIFAALQGGSGVAKAIQTQSQVSGKLGQTKHHSAGGMLTEPVYGVGANSGMPYSFAERRSEYVGPISGTGTGGSGMPHATNTGQQTLIAQNHTMIKLLQQLPSTLGKAISQGSGNGVRHGYFKSQN